MRLRVFCGAALAAGCVIGAPGLARSDATEGVDAPKDMSADAVKRAEAKRRAVIEALYRKGDRAAVKDDLPEAVDAWRAAYKLDPSPFGRVCTLGRAEMRIHRYRDAAEHLAVCVRRAPAPATPTEEKRQQEERKEYKEARAKVGAIRVTVSEPGAKLEVDGQDAGVSPLVDDVFVLPGPHLITATLPDRAPATATVTLKAGETRALELLFVVLAPKPPAARLADRPDSSTQPPGPSMQPPGPSTQPPGPLRFGQISAPPEKSSVREPRGVFSALSKLPAWAYVGGGVLSAGFLTAGGVFTYERDAAAKESLDVLGSFQTYPAWACAAQEELADPGCPLYVDARKKEGVYGSLARWSLIVGATTTVATAALLVVRLRYHRTSVQVSVAPDRATIVGTF